MPGPDRTEVAPIDPVDEMRRLHLMAGPWVAQTLYVAAALGVVDHLGDDPVPIATLAKLCEAHEGALYRFGRTLAALGVLREHPGRTFTSTALGDTLRSDHPATLRWGVLLHGGETFRAWADVMHTVRTGRPAFEHVFGEPFFDYVAGHPDLNQVFNRTMGVTDAIPAVLDAYDFAGADTIVDLGGGIGTLLAEVLVRTPGARGVLQDLPAGVQDAPAHLAARGVADRCEVIGRSFFAAVPPGDRYLLSRVLHNWADADAVTLLRSIRTAMRPGGRVVVIDHLLQTQNGFHPGVFADLHMLVVLGGHDRTREELRDLLAAGGFRVTAVHTAPVAVNPRTEALVEAVAED